MLKSSLPDGNDERKTNAQLIAELAAAHQRVIELAFAEAARRDSEERCRRLFDHPLDRIRIREDIHERA